MHYLLGCSLKMDGCENSQSENNAINGSPVEVKIDEKKEGRGGVKKIENVLFVDAGVQNSSGAFKG